MTIAEHINPGVRFRTPASRGWTENPEERAQKGPIRLARIVRYLAAGS
jgi:hypothetical protein